MVAFSGRVNQGPDGLPHEACRKQENGRECEHFRKMAER
jgi:hypothetical protein